MTFLNRVVLTGRVITPPRHHYRPDGSAVIEFPLELNDSEDLAGQPPTHTAARKGGRNRIDIVAFGELAEFQRSLLQSGQYLMVTGRLNQRRWQTPEGRHRTCTEVIATSFQAIEENTQTQKSTHRLTDLEIDGCSELTLRSAEPNLQRRDMRLPDGSKKQGE